MKSKIDVRVFAIEKAVVILGAGTPPKDVVAKAKEIEAYVIGNADIPEVDNKEDAVFDMLKGVVSLIGSKDVGQ